MAPSGTSGTKLVLPPQITGVADVLRIRRELETFYEYLHQAALRHDDPSTIRLPKTSRELDGLVQANKLDLLHRDQYEQTMSQLDEIERSAPRVHVSFSADPSANFVERIVDWFRRNVDPATLVQIGLQPALAAGCVVRTTNKQFDLSLKKHFATARPLLIQKIEEHIGAAAAAAPVAAEPTPAMPAAPPGVAA